MKIPKVIFRSHWDQNIIVVKVHELETEVLEGEPRLQRVALRMNSKLHASGPGRERQRRTGGYQ